MPRSLRESPAQRSTPPAPLSGERLTARGKFFWANGDKLYLRGVTYGTFRPDWGEQPYPDPNVVDRDLEEMAAQGLNAIRTYTVPPLRILDQARAKGLRFLVGIPWEQHVTFLDEKRRAERIRRRVHRSVAATRGHPAILGYTIGNEIPAPIVRWHGPRKIESFIRELYESAKDADPEALVTYVNYPTTEYLELPFLDFFAFNVFLESEQPLQAYLARLHNLAGDRPVIMAEIGLDSRRHGELGQAAALSWQIQSAFRSGCAGTFIFSWTDEWYRGGFDIEDWDFGLTTRGREPKPALDAVRAAYSRLPLSIDLLSPRVSVVICTYNGAPTIDETLERVSQLDYPDFEVIVVNDGSTDATERVIRRYQRQGVRAINTPNRGLAAARNTGLKAATGEIVAYIDDDAYPDPDWLTYIVAALSDGEFVGVGGPNIVPADDALLAQCVGHSPGGPAHVLLSDRVAEHIPGCNMAFRKSALECAGGFDPRFRAAGDDVDVCWKIQSRGLKLGFHPGALVWHHRRGSLTTYWKQQVGYGKAEALLEEKWPEKYNSAGHVSWAGRIYGTGLTKALRLRPSRVYQGTWGLAPFQSLYQPGPGSWLSLPLMPEWYLVIAGLAASCLLGLLWSPLLLALPVLLLAVAATLGQALISSVHANCERAGSSVWSSVKCRSLIFLLHLAQPAARLLGRVRQGLTPWRPRHRMGWNLPTPRSHAIWSEQWNEPSRWLVLLERSLGDRDVATVRGGAFDRWDVEVRGGLFGAARALLATEEHGAGRQYMRFRVWPKLRKASVVFTLPAIGLYIVALTQEAWLAAAFIGVGAAFLSYLTLRECGAAQAAFMTGLRGIEGYEG
jgi:GT2 family glycosyltransferase